jgi:predicted nucleic acid-binding protein
LIFLDTNILIYAAGVHGEQEPRTHAARNLVLTDDLYAISVQVLQEFFDKVTRHKIPLTRERARAYILQWRAYHVEPLTLELFDLALFIEARYKFRYWDCAILAAAILCGAGTVLSEDMKHGQVVEGVRIINPFIAPE